MEGRRSRLSRRQFVLGAGAAGLLAGCGRLPWQAQQPAKIHRIGLLSAGATEAYTAAIDAFRQGLREHGYFEGQNLAIEWRLADGRFERLPELAAELVRLDVEVIVTGGGTPAILAARNATTTIPIVFTTNGDPVGLGLVASLAHPGGNVTGLSLISPELTKKRLELLKDTLPSVSLIAVLWNPDNPTVALEWRETQTAARVLGVELKSLEVRQPDELQSTFEAPGRERAGTLLVLTDPLFFSQRTLVVDLAAKAGLPAMYFFREFAEAGGLMAYGPSILDQWRRSAYFVDRILKGTKPADLPVEQPMTFEFVVNMKTARELGITFPNEIMLQVTEVIQ